MHVAQGFGLVQLRDNKAKGLQKADGEVFSQRLLKNS